MSVWHAASDHFHELISFNELHHELQNTSVTDIVSNYEPLVVPWEMYCSKKLSCIYIYGLYQQSQQTTWEFCSVSENQLDQLHFERALEKLVNRLVLAWCSYPRATNF